MCDISVVLRQHLAASHLSHVACDVCVTLGGAVGEGVFWTGGDGPVQCSGRLEQWYFTDSMPSLTSPTSLTMWQS